MNPRQIEKDSSSSPESISPLASAAAAPAANPPPLSLSQPGAVTAANSSKTLCAAIPKDAWRSIIAPMLFAPANPLNAGSIIKLMEGIPGDPSNAAYQEIQSAFGWTQATLLLQYVVCGNQDAAERMLQANPDLLLKTATVTDYSGRSITATPFQAALRMQDVEMWKMMIPYFTKLHDNDNEKEKQIAEEFPDGKLPEQIPYDFSYLAQAITEGTNAEIQSALNKSTDDTKIYRILNRFREEFTALSLNEKHFNPQHQVTVFAVYNDWDDKWSDNQRDLFWRQVVGYVQRYLPSCYAQALCQGICNILSGEEVLRRVFDYRYVSGSFYPLSSVSSSGLGFDHASKWHFASPAPRGVVSHYHDFYGLWRGRDMFESYLKQKQLSLASLRSECNALVAGQTSSLRSA